MHPTWRTTEGRAEPAQSDLRQRSTATARGWTLDLRSVDQPVADGQPLYAGAVGCATLGEPDHASRTTISQAVMDG